ncbi:hypothetical protein AMATHDRAFT_9822 [Amanita thiersii Skay4041]|uniref:Uncharacterized protein n=1 Tax=Amanita thiersii Skay4041 TaxID=703135 RepID=A0A2A9NC44_9AGAR|nr:hypothetical protein AMATHDRAFT_9822 [Amanita thiersii Skay4041]
MFSPTGSFRSPGEIMTAQWNATVKSRGIPMVVPAPKRQPDYSHFPPTPEAIKTHYEPEELPKNNPLSPFSRFRYPPSTSSIQQPSTFHAGPWSSEAACIPLGNAFCAFLSLIGALIQLLEETALLDKALTDGELPSEVASNS